MTLLLTLVALASGPPSEPVIFDIGNGCRAMVVRGSTDPNDSEYYASSVNIQKSGRSIAHLRARALIDGWLKSDAVWPSHNVANQMRFFDHPRAGASGLLQGWIYEAVPSSDGCLLRVGLINTGPSFPHVDLDFVVRWKLSAPDKWQVLYSFADNNLPTREAIRLPRYKGVQYLVTEAAVYRLSPDPSQRTLVINMPAVPDISPKWIGSANWFCFKQSGPHMILTQPTFDPHEYRFKDLNLLTGKLSQPNDATLRKFGVNRPDHIGN
jgi:hypothetical protein